MQAGPGVQKVQAGLVVAAEDAVVWARVSWSRGRDGVGWGRTGSTRAPRKGRGKLPTGGSPSPESLSLVGQPEGPAGRRKAWSGQVASPGWGSPSSSWFCFSSLILCRQRLRNLIIFRAAWSCFLVRKEPLFRAGSGPEGR